MAEFTWADSVKEKDEQREQGQKKSLLEMREALEKKKKSKGQYEKVEDEDGSFSDEAKAADEAELEKELMEAPAIRQHKAMRERPSLLGTAKWYDKLFFNWTFKVIQVSILLC